MEANILLNFNLKNYQRIIDDLIIASENNNSIYSGKAGIILYFIELYEITKNEDFLSEAENLARKIFENIKDKEASFYAFFTGDMGVSYVFLRLYKITQKQYFLDCSIHIAKKSKNHLALQKKPIIDLINGVSGILLGLLHIHEAGVNDEWLLDDIKFYVDYIVSKTELGAKGGIFWDVTNKINQGLTGFSHGASGIGFVFDELYKRTGIEGFRQISLQTVLYEDNCYDKEKKNWYDYRMSPFTETETVEFDSETKSENIDFYLLPKFMNAWCHGAPGVLLARFNLGITNEKTTASFNEVMRGLDNFSNHSLCHSGVGNTLCLMSIEIENKTVFKESLQVLCQKLIAFFEVNTKFISGYNDKSYNKSLMMGDLGVLYFLLKAHSFIEHGKIENNVLYPILSNESKSEVLSKMFSNYDSEYVSTQIIRNHYPKTLYLLEKKQIKIVPLQDKPEERFIAFLDALDDEFIKDAFTYERSIRTALMHDNSYSFNFYRNKVDVDLIENKNTNFNELVVFVSPRLHTIKTKWNWDSLTNPKWTLNNDLTQQESEFMIVSNWEVKVIKSTNFYSQLVAYIADAGSVKVDDIIEYFINLISVENHQKQEAQKLILNNIVQLIKVGAINIVHEKI